MAAAPGHRLPVASADAMWLQDSPTNRMVITGLYTLDRIDLDTLRRLWQERVIGAEGGERWPRFTHRVVADGGRFFWQQDPDFHIDRHIVQAPGAGEIRGEEELQRHLAERVSEPLVDDRPLWQLSLIPDFGGGRSAIVVRVHHCMGDGIGLIPVLYSIQDPIDDAPGAGEPDAPPRLNAETAAAEVAKPKRSKWSMALKLPFAFPAVLLGKLLSPADRSPVHGPELSGEKRVAWSTAIPLDRVKAIKDGLGVTLNDVLLASVTGAFRRHVDAVGGGSLERLRASVPVNVRAAGERLKMENRFAAVPFALPAHLGDAHERLHEVRRRTDRMKRSIEPVVVYLAQRLLLKALPAGASRKLIDVFANKCSCVLTNVPGPRHAMAIGGRRLHDMMFWVPARSRIGVGVSLLSFSGAVRLGVIADRQLIDDPAALVAAFEAELEALESAV